MFQRPLWYLGVFLCILFISFPLSIAFLDPPVYRSISTLLACLLTLSSSFLSGQSDFTHRLTAVFTRRLVVFISCDLNSLNRYISIVLLEAYYCVGVCFHV